MSASQQMIELANTLRHHGYEVVLPEGTELFATGDKAEMTVGESTANKRHGDLIRGYFEEIKRSDIVLVANFAKHGREGYIGGNVFLEFAFGHVLGKQVYLLYPHDPTAPYADEILAMDHRVLDGDVSHLEV